MRSSLVVVLMVTVFALTGCSQQHHPNYRILKNVPKSQVSTVKKVIQEEGIKNLELPTKLPYEVTVARFPNPAIDPQRKHVIRLFIGNKNGGRVLEIDASEYPSTTPVNKSVLLPNEQTTHLGDGTRAIYGNNGHGSQLAWVKDGVLYMIASVNKQGKSDLTEKQLLQVADSFQ